MNSSGLESSVKGFRIRWNKEPRLDQSQRQHLKKDLLSMAEEILRAMDSAKEEGARNEIAEVRLPLPAHAHLHAYLTIEYSNDAWHMILETLDECLGEIVCPSTECIQMLDDNEVDEEVL